MTKKNLHNYYTDENAARLIAVQIIILALAVWYFKSPLLLIVLIADSALRAFTFWPSPLAFISKSLLFLIKAEPRPVPAAPRILTAKAGCLLSAAAVVLWQLKYPAATSAVCGMLITFSFAEAALKFCPGSPIYRKHDLGKTKNSNK